MSANVSLPGRINFTARIVVSEPKMKKSYHSMRVPVEAAKMTRPIRTVVPVGA